MLNCEVYFESYIGFAEDNEPNGLGVFHSSGNLTFAGYFKVQEILNLILFKKND